METLPIIIPELEIDPEEGFEKNDLFKFKEFGSKLANLILGCGGNITIGLEGEWGTGKTTFIKMWQGHIKNHFENSMQSIYFNAFANDYQKDLFLALVSQIYNLIEDKDKTIKENFTKHTKKIALAMAKGSLKLGVNVLSAGIIKGDEISKIVSDEVNKFVDDNLKSVKNNANLIEDFKTNLEKWIENQKNPVVFIIDELDRCRPDFALELIEKIKHFFSVKGLVFLLVVNKEQLESSIEHKYGVKDASTYLQKFIHFWQKLPKKTIDRTRFYGNDYENILDYIAVYRNQFTNFSGVFFLLQKLAENFKITIRQFQRIYTYLAFINNILVKKRPYIPLSGTAPNIITFVCYAKVCDSDILEDIVNNRNKTKVLEKIKKFKKIESHIDDFHIKTKTHEMKVIYNLYSLIKYEISTKEEREKQKDENLTFKNLIEDQFKFERDNLTKFYYDCIHFF